MIEKINEAKEFISALIKNQEIETEKEKNNMKEEKGNIEARRRRKEKR